MSTLRTDYLQTTDSAITVAVASLVNSSNSALQTYQNIAALRASVVANGAVVKTLGYYSPADSGSGTYYHDTSDTSSSDNGGSIIVSAEGKRFKLVRDSEVTVKTFGARGNGTDDDTAQVVAAITAGFSVVFPVGTYPLVATTFSTPVTFREGAVLSATAGTFAFTGTFSAPIAKIFNFTGTAVATFNLAKRYQGFPEWWGAVSENASVDNSTAINACIVALTETQLLPVRYYTTGTVKLQLNYRKLLGALQSWTSQGGTQIISNSNSATIIKMGLDANPNDPNNNAKHVELKNITLNRNVATLDSTSLCYGVDAEWLFFGLIEDVESINSKVGFYSSGDLELRKSRCYAFRHLLGTVPASDSFYGYLYNGNSGGPFAGGNASMFDRDCTAACPLTVAQCPINVGFCMDGKPADYSSFGCSVSQCRQGQIISGSGTLGGDADIRLDNFVADGIGLDGILVSNCRGSITIFNSYAAPISTATTFTGLRVVNSSGVHENGNQYICVSAPNSCGVSFTNVVNSSVGAQSHIRDAARPMEMFGALSCSIKGSVLNTSVSCTQGAVYINSGTSRCEFATAVSGDVQSRFSYGYNCSDATPNNNKFDWTMISPTFLGSGLATNRLAYNGVGQGATVGVLTNGNFSVGQPS